MTNTANEDAQVAESEHAHETERDPRSVLHYLRVTTYSLALLLGLSLLAVGTVAIVAQIKGTWHWMIHLESMVSYMAVFISAVLVALVPLFGALVIARWRYDE